MNKLIMLGLTWYLMMPTVVAAEPTISVIEAVKIKSGYRAEAMYYYNQNWRVYRDAASKQGYIQDFDLLEITEETESESDFDILLVTTYANQYDFSQSESRFNQLIAAGGDIQLLNNIKPQDFRQRVFVKSGSGLPVNHILPDGLLRHQNPNAHDREIEQVAQPLNRYLSGHIKGDSQLLGSALHSQGKLSYLRDGQYSKLEFVDYLKRMKLRDLDDGVQRLPYIKSVDVTGNVAIAKLVLDYSTRIFTDYMTLLKINGEWKITNKIAYSLSDPHNNKTLNATIVDVLIPLQHFVNAFASNNIQHMQSTMHEETKITYVNNQRFQTLSLADILSLQKPTADTTYAIQSVDSTGNAAVGKVLIKGKHSTMVSYLSLLNIKGAWKVVNIAFQSSVS